ncbi:MAG TPA: hypothetical protein VKT77_10845 [Chthonomonadaceae bacterium]|nr:hypothetical protein [Chthonomonadaceae bacterium]
MSSLLRLGQEVLTESSHLPCVVEAYLGAGGQGEVYRARWAGEQVALKWYFTPQATREQREAIRTLVEVRSPTDRFLWPLELATYAGARGFGYVMALREPRYKSITDLMMRRAEPGFHALATAGMGLADSFLQLHARGLCYRDISFGNLFFDPDTGAVLICDNDNVGVNGSTRTGILGTPRFMAPEIVRHEASPSIQTDLYSLAVLLFYLLVVHHPLEGRREAAIKCLDLPAMNRIYGERPLFIFDPEDDSNAPVPGYHENALAFWPLYPAPIKRIFIRAFTEGLRAPARRVRESEWRAAFAQLRDLVVTCECGQESFICEETCAHAGSARECWSCGAPVAAPPRLRVGGKSVVLAGGTRLFGHHLDPDCPYDFGEPLAAVVENPHCAGQLGLQNGSALPWRVLMPGGFARMVEPGRSVALASGARIDFGTAHGEIVT